MSRGGNRPGSGRPKGAMTKRTREIAERASAEGITPLEYMLNVLRDETMPAATRMDAAKAAAPYVHAKLASVEHKGEDGGPLQIVVRQFTLAGS